MSLPSKKKKQKTKNKNKNKKTTTKKNPTKLVLLQKDRANPRTLTLSFSVKVLLKEKVVNFIPVRCTLARVSISMFVLKKRNTQNQYPHPICKVALGSTHSKQIFHKFVLVMGDLPKFPLS